MENGKRAIGEERERKESMHLKKEFQEKREK